MKETTASDLHSEWFCGGPRCSSVDACQKVLSTMVPLKLVRMIIMRFEAWWLISVDMGSQTSCGAFASWCQDRICHIFTTTAQYVALNNDKRRPPQSDLCAKSGDVQTSISINHKIPRQMPIHLPDVRPLLASFTRFVKGWTRRPSPICLKLLANLSPDQHAEFFPTDANCRGRGSLDRNFETCPPLFACSLESRASPRPKCLRRR